MPDQETETLQVDELATDQELDSDESAGSAGEQEGLKATDRSHFFAVANSLIGALHWQSPQLVLPDSLTRREVDALTNIYEARTAEETEYGAGHISGLERMRYLNEGLITLQGVLGMARSDTFPQARGHIEEIRKLIARLKQEIAQAIVAEERRKQEEKDKKEQETKKSQAEAKAKQAAQAHKHKKA